MSIELLGRMRRSEINAQKRKVNKKMAKETRADEWLRRA